jgi:RNA polymerase sigma-70 factor, ECF subfamily
MPNTTCAVHGENAGPVVKSSGAFGDSPASASDAGIELEAALLTAARNGDLQSFGELIERHRGECMKRAMLILRNHSDAEDEVQNAFWKALQRLDQYRGEGPFAAWLGRIVENQCLMRLRDARSARSVCLDKSPESNIGVELVYQFASPEDQLGTQEVISLLRREVQRIPPLLRHVMVLHDLDQLPINDVAYQLGVSVPAAKSRLIRARGELRSRITKHCGRKGAGTLMYISRYAQAVFKRAS